MCQEGSPGWQTSRPVDGAAEQAGYRRPRGLAGRRALADVADRVSSGLVSAGAQEPAGPERTDQARVLEAAQELGYRADRTASLLARRRSRHLGVLMDVRNTFHAELVTGSRRAPPPRSATTWCSAL